MPVRNFTRLLLWLCALLIVHFDDSFAKAPGSARPETPASTAASAADQNRQPQPGSVDAEPDKKLSDSQNGVPETGDPVPVA